MQYKRIHKAIFLSRPNRFIAHVMLNGKNETVHVKNTGRCKELLVPGATVYLEEGEYPARKTKYDLIAVEKVVTDERLQIFYPKPRDPRRLCRRAQGSQNRRSKNHRCGM